MQGLMTGWLVLFAYKLWMEKDRFRQCKHNFFDVSFIIYKACLLKFGSLAEAWNMESIDLNQDLLYNLCSTPADDAPLRWVWWETWRGFPKQLLPWYFPRRCLHTLNLINVKLSMLTSWIWLNVSVTVLKDPVWYRIEKSKFDWDLLILSCITLQLKRFRWVL